MAGTLSRWFFVGLARTAPCCYPEFGMELFTSGAMSAPFGHVTVPPSMKNFWKELARLSGSKTGPDNQDWKSTLASVPSLKVRRIRKAWSYVARTTLGRNTITRSLLQGRNAVQRFTCHDVVPVRVAKADRRPPSVMRHDAV